MLQEDFFDLIFGFEQDILFVKSSAPGNSRINIEKRFGHG